MPERIAASRHKIEARLTVLSDSLSASELQAMIGLTPDEAWHSGDPIGRSGRAFQRFSGWSIGEGPSEEPAESHISALLDRVATRKQQIASAAGDPRVQSVALWVWSQGRTFGLELSPSRLRDIAALGATLKIDIYDGDEDGPDS